MMVLLSVYFSAEIEKYVASEDLDFLKQSCAGMLPTTLHQTYQQIALQVWSLLVAFISRVCYM